MRKNTFQETLNNAQYFCKGDKKTCMCIGEVYLDDIYIDEAYQGYRKHKKTDSLVANWNINDYNPIKVVPRFDLGRFSVFEGQNRYLAANKLGITKLPAVICLPENNNVDRQKFEAVHFVRQDRQTEKLKALQKHGALLVMQDHTAMLLERMSKEYGFKILADQASGNKSAGVLGSYGDTYGFIKSAGNAETGKDEELANFIFSTMKSLGWMYETNGMSRAAIRSLSRIWNAHSDDPGSAKERILKWANSRKNKEKSTLKKMIIDANKEYSGRNDDAALTMYIEEIVTGNGKGKIERRIFPADNGRGIKINKV